MIESDDRRYDNAYFSKTLLPFSFLSSSDCMPATQSPPIPTPIASTLRDYRSGNHPFITQSPRLRDDSDHAKCGGWARREADLAERGGADIGAVCAGAKTAVAWGAHAVGGTK